MRIFKTPYTSNFFFEHILLFFFGYDVLVKLFVSFFGLVFLYNYAIVFKAVVVLLAIKPKIVLVNLNKSYLLALGLLLLSFFAVKFPHLFNQRIEDVNFNGYYFLSCTTPILFLIFFTYDRLAIERQVNGFLVFISLSSLFVFIGYLYDLDFLRTYFRGQRFGYSGLLLYHHESGFIYFIALILAYKKLREKSTFFNVFVFSTILASSFLIGTKKTLFLVIISQIYFAIDNFRYLIRKIYYVIGGVFVLIIFNGIALKIFYRHYLFLYNLYVNEGFWTMFLSFRNDLLTENLIPYIFNNLALINIVFGWPLFRDFRSELELFDLFLYFGILGIVSYILIFINILKNASFLSYFLIFSLLLATLFSGNLLASVNVMVLMFISIYFLGMLKNPQQ